MKASLKFREEQRPLIRAKVPLSILGLPLQSGILFGESKELTLNLTTFFESGPSVKIAYRPNDTWNPFSLVVKTGTGSFGSPISSSMLMSAEFNLVGKGNPTFMLHFKPQFGDFSLKKTHSSAFDSKMRSTGGADSDEASSMEAMDSPPHKLRDASRKLHLLPSAITTGDIAGLFSGVEMAAKTAFPVKQSAVVSFRWGVRIPPEIKNCDLTNGVSYRSIPFLVMNKIGIEHVHGSDSKETSIQNKDSCFPVNADMVSACFTVNRQMEALQGENELLKKAVEGLRQEFGGGRRLSLGEDLNSGSYRESERNGSKSKMERRNDVQKSVSDSNGNGDS